MSDPHATDARVCKHCGGTDAEHMQGDDGLLCDYDRMLPPLHATGSSAAKPDCPHCGGSGVVEIQSSGNREIGFDREWDDCDCKYEDATPDRAAEWDGSARGAYLYGKKDERDRIRGAVRNLTLLWDYDHEKYQKAIEDVLEAIDHA